MVARHADLWNGYGDTDRIARMTDLLRTSCAEVGRPFESLERTVMLDGVLRDEPAEALAARTEWEERHGLRDQIGSDGSPGGLQAWGPPAVIADQVRPYIDLGVAEMIWIFRSPFDLESIRRLGEVRAALSS